jgi:hypothetical protein
MTPIEDPVPKDVQPSRTRQEIEQRAREVGVAEERIAYHRSPFWDYQPYSGGSLTRKEHCYDEDGWRRQLELEIGYARDKRAWQAQARSEARAKWALGVTIAGLILSIILNLYQCAAGGAA